MIKTIFTTASIFGALSVAFGAFAAHGLKGQLDPYSLEIFQKGVEYQNHHALALLAIGLIAIKFPGQLIGFAANFMTAGVLLFSGSLYLLATRSILGIDEWAKILGPITPIGGLFLITSWILLAIHVIKNVKL
ncbi:MAG: DUF423 domain-containing protein [Chitinophagales bacterium]|nr:DUF423 domain-containing protein [Chitinophagales bacterium]